jgi:uncharacterized protein
MNYYLIAAVIGLISGVTSGLFGVGGGIIMVPAMFWLLQVPIKTAIGTSLAVIIPTALMGTYKHWGQGNVDWKVALALMPTAVLGGYLGVWLVSMISAEHLRRGFAVFLMLVGLRLLLFNK